MKYAIIILIFAYFMFPKNICFGAQLPRFRIDYLFEQAFKTFYKVHHTCLTWQEARIRCEAEGTELLVPDSLDEADVLIVLVATIQTQYDGVFVGLHDLYSKQTFVTPNGDAMQNTILDLLWSSMEPMNGAGRCVAMRRNGLLFVHPCTSGLPFICKIKTENIIYNEDCDTFDLSWKQTPSGQCYTAHSEPQTWFDAYTTCLSSGGYLAILNSRKEADYIRDLFKQITEQRIPDNDFAFLGFSDLFQRHHYRTVHGQPLSDTGYSDWDNKCSNESDSLSQGEDRCGGIHRSGLLSTRNCHVPTVFFCEKTGKPCKSSEESRKSNESLTGGV